MKELNKIKDILWSFVKINLLCWAAFVCCSLLLVLILYHDVPPGQRDYTAIYWILHIIYFFAYHKIFTINIENEKIELHYKDFGLRQTVVDFFREDRLQIIMLIIFSIIFEIAMIVHPGPQNLVATIFVMYIPSAGAINIPILRTVIGFTISLVSMLLSTVLIRYKKHKYWNK